MPSPDYVPPAFRRHVPGTSSFIGMTDDQVIKIAATALHMVQTLPMSSKARAEQWAAFDHAMGELSARATMHALEKIHQHNEQLLCERALEQDD